VKPETIKSIGAKLAERVQMVAPVLRHAAILWVDDHPEYNAPETRILTSIGINVEAVRSTAEALARLAKKPYSVVISDMEREGVKDAGIQLLQQMQAHGIETPTIFYAAGYDPARGTPPNAAGMTNRADDLLNDVLDALERV
jgi:CheY-like chemotaxis protein